MSVVKAAAVAAVSRSALSGRARAFGWLDGVGVLFLMLGVAGLAACSHSDRLDGPVRLSLKRPRAQSGQTPVAPLAPVYQHPRLEPVRPRSVVFLREPTSRPLQAPARKSFSFADAPASPRVATAVGRIPKGGGRYKLGLPYAVAGHWYVPREDKSYDATGIASWYGSDFHGRRTANGEIYDKDALTAAHPTLPLPSYVYATNLDTGRTLLLRVNDRGPYASGRIMDLSQRAALILGSEGRGLARIRVRYAGRAPLDGNDVAEQRFLANQALFETAHGTGRFQGSLAAR